MSTVAPTSGKGSAGNANSQTVAGRFIRSLLNPDLVDAYMEALRLAGVTDRTSLRAESIAHRVIFFFEHGETDTWQIARSAIEEPDSQKPRASEIQTETRSELRDAPS